MIVGVILEKEPECTIEDYLANLHKYKEIIDRTPTEFLKFHLEYSVKKEHYELAAYIRDEAARRGHELA